MGTDEQALMRRLRRGSRTAAAIVAGVVAVCGCAAVGDAPPATAAVAPNAAPATPAQSASDRAARTAAALRMEGTWIGTFRRYDAAGALTQTLPSEVRVRFPSGRPHDYEQTNVLTMPDGTVQTIETVGAWHGRVLRFSNPRIDGWFTEIDADASGLNSVLWMSFKDGSGLTMSEIITLAPDGNSRLRAAQYNIAGKLVRTTLVAETRTAR